MINWIKYPFLIFGACFLYGTFFGHSFFIAKPITDLWLKFYFISGFILFVFVWIMLKRNNNTLSMPDSIEKSASTKTYTPVMTVIILFYTLVFGGVVSLSVANVVLEAAVWLTSNTPVQFKTTVTDAFQNHTSGRGTQCKGTEYRFYSPPLGQYTWACDWGSSLGFKEGDTLLVTEKVGFAGARFVSAEHVL